MKQYLLPIWRRLWLVALIIFAITFTTFLVSIQMTPVYRATTTLMVNERAPANPAITTRSCVSERLTLHVCRDDVTAAVLAETIRTLGLPMEEEELAKRVSVRPSATRN